jgi:hypothetical protein
MPANRLAGQLLCLISSASGIRAKDAISLIKLYLSEVCLYKNGSEIPVINSRFLYLCKKRRYERYHKHRISGIFGQYVKIERKGF